MPEPTHLIIAYAGGGGPQALAAPALPRLDRLLARLTLRESDAGDEGDYQPPHLRAFARALGLPQAATPWAAWQTRRWGQACAWFTPCHWQAGMDQVYMHPPEALALAEPDERALLALLAPWLAQDGIALDYHAPLRWLARGEGLDALDAAALERVQGRDVSHWKPRGAYAGRLQRLHGEVQMLLYEHAFNDARSRAGQLPVNAFWIHGAGRIDHPPATATAPTLLTALQAPALAGDWRAWASAWQQLDAGPLAELAAQAARGEAVALTLAGERSALTWHSAARGLGQKITGLFRPKRFEDVREQL